MKTRTQIAASPGHGASASRSAGSRRIAARTAAATATLLAGALLFAFSNPASADQHWNLEDGLPTIVEDAFTQGPGGVEAQVTARWNKEQDGSDQVELRPRFSWGFGDRMELRAGGTALLGGDRTGSGDLRLEGMWQFNELSESRIPALAGLVAVDLPTGKDTRGTDTTLKLIATQAIGGPQSMQRLHAILGWTDNDRPHPGERNDRREFGVGYSQPFGQAMTLVADLVRQEGRLEGQRGTIAEVGLRWHLAAATVASVGIGFGSGSGVPDYRLIAGIQLPL